MNGTLLNDDNQAQLESPEPGAAIVIDGATAPLNEAVVPLQLNSVPSDLYRMFTIIREDMNRLSALDDVQRGADGEIRKSAPRPLSGIGKRRAGRRRSPGLWNGRWRVSLCG